MDCLHLCGLNDLFHNYLSVGGGTVISIAEAGKQYFTRSSSRWP
jgi:hypothetical protein